jgi:hypothetical protein
MARIVQGFRYSDYVSLLARDKSDVERMSPRARKEHLKRQVRLVEAQIGLVLDKLVSDEPEMPSRTLVWAGSHADENRWASLLSLEFLVAEREALVEAIDVM